MALPRLGTNRPLTALPFDIILNIIEYLDVDDLTNLEGVRSGSIDYTARF